MRRAWIVMLWVVVALAAGAGPAAAAETCRDASREAALILRQSLHQPPPERPALPEASPAAGPARQPAGLRVGARDPDARISGESVRLRVTLDAADGITWKDVRLHGVARTRDEQDARPRAAADAAGRAPDTLCLHRFTPVYARLVTFEGRDATIEVNYPDHIPGLRSALTVWHDWVLVVGLESKTQNPHGSAEPQLFGYATVETRIGSDAWATAIGLLLVIAIYLALARVALQVNRRRLERAAARAFAAEAEPPAWRRRAALNPIFITQDASGVGSLARLQLLVFTLAVAFVYAYVLVRTGELAALSPDVLKLLGITVVGSGLARVTGDTGSVSAPNRIWLKGRRLVISDEARLPRVSDLVCADGEVEIARVQAIVFSALTVGALLLHGRSDLGGFEISDEMLVLLGLSQLTFVVGKAVPGETIRRLNQEINAARAAEKQIQGVAGRRAALAQDATAEIARVAEDAAAARAAWEAALTAAEDTLLDVYGEMLDTDRLIALRTGAA
jgi:hypothetical protein